MLKEHMERPFADVFADNPNHQPSSTRHLKHLQIILTLTTETTPGFKSFSKQALLRVVPKTTLRFNDSVERLTELRKTVKLMYDSLQWKDRLISAKEKDTQGRIQERSMSQLSSFSGVTRTALILPVMMCDNIQKCFQPEKLTWAFGVHCST